MPDPSATYPHIWVRDRAQTEELHRPGGGNPKIRPVERRAHGKARLGELQQALDEFDRLRDEQELTLDELRALGVVLVLEGAETAYRLKLDSLEQLTNHKKRLPRWLLLSVTPPEEDRPERAQVWVSDAYRAQFLKRFEDYLDTDTKKGNPKNQELVANIGRIRRAVLDDLWQSSDPPPIRGKHWWELWLRRTDDAAERVRRYAEVIGAPLAVRSLELNDRLVVWIQAQWDDLQALPFTDVPLAEIRRPEFVDTIEDLPDDERDDLATDLVDRIQPTSDPAAPAVCHLDTGVRRTHVLLAGSLDPADVHSVVDSPGGSDPENHGTPMAGLALYGPLDDLLLTTKPVALYHRLESVKFLPDRGRPQTNPLAYGLITADAVAQPEATARRRRVFCMPVTTKPDRGAGEPTLWSASLDALAAGVDITLAGDQLRLLGAPDHKASRLFVVSAGNVETHDLKTAGYPDACDLAPVEDPAQAWNVLTVGAHTELTERPVDPTFTGWSPVAPEGDLSPHSRTSGPFGSMWPNKPEICMEGGNVLTDGTGGYDGGHPLLSIRTVDARHDLALGSANATSAATAQAARLAALAQARYPSYWPETIRALLVHAAQWTPAMRAHLDQAKNAKTQRRALLRRYGWGVPTEQAVLTSAANAATLVIQDAFVPFDGNEHKARRFRLHRLPWPAAALREIPAAEVVLRITLSYFIEPTASRRGWRQRYTYSSHGLRFELQAPAETTDALLRRVNQEAEQEEDDAPRSRSSDETDRWFIGKNQRNGGSLHQDLWEGTAEELAACDALAVYPVGGWWKNNKRKDRANRTIRYALVLSLKTDEQGIDLYAPIAAQAEIPTTAIVEAPGT